MKNKYMLMNMVIAVCAGLIIALFSCQKASPPRNTQVTPTPPKTALPMLPIPPAINADWKPTFDDEFNGNAINASVWRDGGLNWGPGGGGEQQGYTLNQCNVSDGILHVEADNTPVTVKGVQYQYRSCMLNTMDTFSQTYGYFAFRGKIPQGQGFWPAFWLYDIDNSVNEIDVMENLGYDTSVYYMTYHSPTGEEMHTYHGVDLSQDYHTYSVKWTPDTITFYLDDVQQNTVVNQFHGRMFILIDFAVGGEWPGNPDASTPFPASFDVDYVRAWAMPTT